MGRALLLVEKVAEDPILRFGGRGKEPRPQDGGHWNGGQNSYRRASMIVLA